MNPLGGRKRLRRRSMLITVLVVALLMGATAKPWCVGRMCGVTWGTWGKSKLTVAFIASAEPAAAIVVHVGGKPIPRAAVIVSRNTRLQFDSDGEEGATRVIPMIPW